MNVFSFIFLAEPSLCSGEEFKQLRSFLVSYGPIDEYFTVVAMNCTSKLSLPDKIVALSEKYLSMPPTEDNITAASIMTWACCVMQKSAEDITPATPLLEIMRDLCRYPTTVDYMMYLPSQNGNWGLFKADIRSRMHG